MIFAMMTFLLSQHAPSELAMAWQAVTRSNEARDKCFRPIGGIV